MVDNTKDRKLGNEWADWKGGEKYNYINEGKGMFLILSFIVVLFFSVVTLFAEYLIQPRLIQISPILPLVVRIMVITLISIMITWIFLVSIATITGLNILLNLDRSLFRIVTLIPFVSRVGNRVGISKDRISNSFIKINNSLTRLRKSSTENNNLLLLLPRCITPKLMVKIKELTNKYDIKSFILEGGEAAREKIKQMRPRAIVAVACERDLISGIKDVPSKIKVLGIPNKRPHGPCKNTVFNLRELENSIRFFLNKSPI